ncbi:hypothetical protein yruck0001_27400 [Yersinia ruckeri ATCC 29473]|uniref:Uncharacterized protein n=1 Tax=Yersinia ruckeri TaxID=29486 RepID=A0A0A8VEH7_YERRU|nr:hypothetical protein yruck0001_27400 [Yersinia ruckeri ATCC 29473]CEK26031.1 hypothetical protein CSF007_1185 [Yersinia ruckeri]
MLCYRVAGGSLIFLAPLMYINLTGAGVTLAGMVSIYRPRNGLRDDIVQIAAKSMVRE